MLHLYDLDDEGVEIAGLAPVDPLLDGRVPASSRFRSMADHCRFARYSVHDVDGDGHRPLARGEHTLVSVREFRRVPLNASSLALTVFTAQSGRAAPVVAVLADFVERAVGIYQPRYLLLARSLEDPRVSLLLTAVRDAAALSAAASAAFNMDPLLAELDPLLVDPPECYAYCPESTPLTDAVSPYTV
jgi:hypothetical protein